MSPTKSEKSSTSKLEAPLRFLKGIGPQRASYFARKGIVSLRDALYYFPRKYEDRRRVYAPRELDKIPEGQHVSVIANISDKREQPLRGGKQKMLTVRARGVDAGQISLTWFHVFKGLSEKYPVGRWGVFSGILKRYQGQAQLSHPDVEILPESFIPGGDVKLEKSSLHWGRIVPIYSRTEGLTQKLIREVIWQSLEQGLPLLPEILPASVMERQKLVSIDKAIRNIHFPENQIPDRQVTESAALDPAIRRLIFEEFFKFQLVLLMDRSELKPEKGFDLSIKNKLARQARKNLPFTLTNEQEKVISEILTDLQNPIAMNRILQGDVGSGKTIVALLTMIEAAENGFQSALLVPTEILAEQHYLNALKLLKDTGIEAGYLSGSLTKAQKAEAQEHIKSGKWKIIIGTHAIIQESISWKNLAYAVIDEQHRFGVKQRGYLKDRAPKGYFPHILTMTATPIPRSLALTVFGELAVSTIRERPPGRQEILTKVLAGKERERLYKLLRKEVDAGHQGYIVYPLVTDSEKEGMEKMRSVESEFSRLSEGPLSGMRIGMVHGQMPAAERQQRMQEFKEKKYDVLVATTVIEVGVDVPNATVMGIENAERFGLSQLHQLRGRVGRGTAKSYCVLITDAPTPAALAAIQARAGNEDEGYDESPWTRLEILEKSQDGFFLSEEDLKIRGPGDFFGTAQSGSPSFQLADLNRDTEILEAARSEAQEVFRKDPKLQLPEHGGFKKYFDSVIEEAARALKSG